MFKTLNIYKLTGNQALTSVDLEFMASEATFAPCSPSQDKSVGWVPPRGEAHGLLVENPVAGHYILKLMIETKGVPGATVKAKAQEAADQIEQTTGRKPGKRETKELREDALQALLPQAFSKYSAVWVWIDVAAGTLVHDASSQGKGDEVITALVRTFDGLALTAVQTKHTPGAAMTQWLVTTTPATTWPEGFSVEREVELKSADEEKSSVKFNRHHLLTEEVRKHITEGKLPTRLAMNYEGRLSFVLTESLQIKKLAFLEGVFDDRPDDDSGFDADVALATGELAPFIKALIAALDGEVQADLFGGE